MYYDLILDQFDESVYDEFLTTYFRAKQALTVKRSVIWDTHDEELLQFSKKYPNIIFELYCCGDVRSDMWVKYYFKGKMQLAEANIEFDMFDITKLT